MNSENKNTIKSIRGNCFAGKGADEGESGVIYDLTPKF